MTQRKPEVADVIQVALPEGFAYGRVLRDASVAFYRQFSTTAGQPPIGSRDYLFTVGVYADVLTSGSMPVVGHDPSNGPDDDWPQPTSVTDPISGEVKIYDHGIIRAARPGEAIDLEPAAAWDLADIRDRLSKSRRKKTLLDGWAP